MSDSEDSSIDSNDYSVQDYYRLISPLWESHNAERHYLNHHKLLRTILDFSLTHSLYLKNLQKRELDLGDIETAKFSGIDTLIIRTKNNNSSTNVSSPYQYSGCFRNKYVEFCPQLALAAYLFGRFHVPDSYGSLELQINANTKPSLREIKLLKGSNKLSAISYSQQHKSSISALELSGLNYKDVNLNKLLTTQDFDDGEKLASLEKDNLPLALLAKLAGFEGVDQYNIARDAIEPPQELLDQIFPFLDLEFDCPEYEKLRKVLFVLRRNLCQDMVLLKTRYPNNSLSKHPIFNSDLFNNFAKEMKVIGALDSIPVFVPSDTSYQIKKEKDSIHFDTDSRSTNVQLAQLQKVVEVQTGKISNLEALVNDYHVQHKYIYNHLSDFISKQNDVFQVQSEFLQKIQNTTNGLLVLLTSRNKNMIPLAESSLRETADLFTTVGTANLRKGINNTMNLLEKLNDFNQQHQQSQTQHYSQSHSHQHVNAQIPVEVPMPIPVTQPPPHIQHHQHVSSYPYHPYSKVYTPVEPHVAPPPPAQVIQAPHTTVPLPNMSTPVPKETDPIPFTPEEIKRQTVLNRRLSRQASTLFEMWDDFKGLEQELKNHEITMTEWLKVHGSSERQFRHTRLKIIKFIEDEAARSNCNVEYVKQKLHDKMRNRLRPWTLDEVQRMLTSGKRINMDE